MKQLHWFSFITTVISLLITVLAIYGCQFLCIAKSAPVISMTMIHIWSFTFLIYFIAIVLTWLMVIYRAKQLPFSEPESEYRFYMTVFFTWSFFIWIPSFLGWYFYFFADLFIVWIFIGMLFGWVGVSLLAFAIYSFFQLPKRKAKGN
ncbi:MAG: hypothetical protein AB7I18_01680 [Candidatus Berkiella sp.]